MQIDDLKSKAQMFCDQLETSFNRFVSSSPQNKDLLDHLEFADPMYYDAFRVPQSADGMDRIGRKGRKVGPDYLLHQWTKGYDAGIFKSSPHVKNAFQVWGMPFHTRQALITKWKEDILREDVTDIYGFGKEYNITLDKLDRKFNEKTSQILLDKRIIGCTTTGAAKYREEIKAASADILLVEEAGEILESHILTALGEKTSQLILIGDHKYAKF
jgi:AAA domain